MLLTSTSQHVSGNILTYCVWLLNVVCKRLHLFINQTFYVSRQCAVKSMCVFLYSHCDQCKSFVLLKRCTAPTQAATHGNVLKYNIQTESCSWVSTQMYILCSWTPAVIWHLILAYIVSNLGTCLCFLGGGLSDC